MTLVVAFSLISHSKEVYVRTKQKGSSDAAEIRARRSMLQTRPSRNIVDAANRVDAVFQCCISDQGSVESSTQTALPDCREEKNDSGKKINTSSL